jgi:hypothetical protein
MKIETPVYRGYSPGADRADCTIRATMAVTDLHYREVLEAFAEAGRRRGRGCVRPVQQRAWELLGYAYERVEVRAKTVTTLVVELEKRQLTAPLLVYVRAHLTAAINTRPIEYLAPRRRIREVGRLVRII